MCTKEEFKKMLLENNKIRDGKWDDRFLTMTKYIDLKIKESLEHNTTSQATHDRLLILEECNEEQHKVLKEIQAELKTNSEITRAVYMVYTSANLTKKIVIGFFGAVGIISGAIIGILELTKRIK